MMRHFKVRKLYFFGLFSIFLLGLPNLFSAKLEKTDKVPFRMAFYIDDFGSEWDGDVTSQRAVTANFAINLHQKASDVIIVSIGILKSFIKKRIIGSSEKHKFSKSISFKINDWRIYRIQGSDFFVVILKDKINTIEESNIVKIYEWEALPDNTDILSIPILKNPLDIKVFEKIFIMNYDLQEDDRFNKFRKNIQTENPESDIKEINLTAFLRPMNIVLNGHGGVGSISGTRSTFMTEGLNFLNKLNVNAVLIFSCSSGGRNLDFMQFRESLDNQKISMNLNYMLIVSAVSDAPIISTSPDVVTKFTQFDPSVDIKSFFEAFEVAKTKIKEPSFLKNILKNLSLSSNWFFHEHGINNIPQVLIPNVGWFQYFDVDPDIQSVTDASIAKSLLNPEFEKIDIEKKKGGKKKSLALKRVHLKAGGKIEVNQKLALLLYPEIMPVELEFLPREMEVGTHGGAKFMKATNSLIPKSFVEWNERIPVNNRISDFKKDDFLIIYPSIISMQRGDALHLLSKISVDKDSKNKNVGLAGFIRDGFIILHERESKKAFFIKELQGYNDFPYVLDYIEDKYGYSSEFRSVLSKHFAENITFTNFFINTWFERESGPDKGEHCEIAFCFEDRYWNYRYHHWPVPDAIGNTYRWNFEEITKAEFFEKLGEFGLTHFLDLDLYNYTKLVSDLKTFYQSGSRQFLVGDVAVDHISLKDYLLNCDWNKLDKYVKSGKGLAGDEKAGELVEKLRQLKRLLNSLKSKLNALQQKFIVLKKRLAGEQIGVGKVGLDVEAQKPAVKDIWEIVKGAENRTFTGAELKILSEKFALVSNRIKDDVATRISKQKFVGHEVAKQKIEFIESFDLNNSELNDDQRLNLSYILICLIQNLYFKSIKVNRITNQFDGKEFVLGRQLANIILQNAFQIIQVINALDDSNLYLLDGKFFKGEKQTKKVLLKLLDMILISCKNLSAQDKKKYEGDTEPFILLNDMINGALKSDNVLVSSKLKKLNEKLKLLDTDMKITLGRILVFKLTQDSAKCLWNELLKLLEITADQQSCWKKSKLFDLYALSVELLQMEHYSKGNFLENKNNFYGRLLNSELSAHDIVKDLSMQYFYFELCRFYIIMQHSYLHIKVFQIMNGVIKNFKIRELYIFEVFLSYAFRQDLAENIEEACENCSFNKNLEIKEFDNDSFTLKSGNKYFYKDLNSLRFAFNLITYFLKTEFDSGKNSDWIVHCIARSKDLWPGYGDELRKLISQSTVDFHKEINKRISKK